MNNSGFTFDRPEHPVPKADLVPGAYYRGICRNAREARWDGKKFWYWRFKFGRTFIESIKHRDDDDIYDVFDAECVVPDNEVENPIDLQALYNE